MLFSEVPIGQLCYDIYTCNYIRITALYTWKYQRPISIHCWQYFSQRFEERFFKYGEVSAHEQWMTWLILSSLKITLKLIDSPWDVFKWITYTMMGQVTRKYWKRMQSCKAWVLFLIQLSGQAKISQGRTVRCLVSYLWLTLCVSQRSHHSIATKLYHEHLYLSNVCCPYTDHSRSRRVSLTVKKKK